jgi:hypothetical protein
VIVVGSAVVAFGGGGIPVARRYLERWSMSAEGVARDVKRNADPEAGKAALQERLEKEQAQARGGEGGTSQLSP